MTTIQCRTLYNQTRDVPAESLIQRPSVYGLIIHEGSLLVAQGEHTHKFVLPGGGIEKGETMQAALEREIWEETGVRSTMGDFLHFETDFFYYDPLDLAIHGFLFFYRAQALTTALTPPPYPPDEGLEKPLWVAVADLNADSFQGHGEMTMKLVARCLQSEYPERP